MSKKIHIIGIPHTIISQKYSTCAYTGKILRFPLMMKPLGWTIVEYSNEGSESTANQHFQVLSADEFKSLSLIKSNTQEFTIDVNNEQLNKVFYEKMYKLLADNVLPGDIVCHTFGPMRDLLESCPKAFHVEMGIGYSANAGFNFRIFESAIWQHWHLGKESKINGSPYHWVCPNYYNLDEWKFNARPKDYVLFFSRLAIDKGLRIIYEIAKRLPEKKFILCGQCNTPNGDIFVNPIPNIQYMPPVYGNARSEILGNASVVLCPSEYIEPFCGTCVEAQLTGTPVVSSSFGAFLETIEDEKTGFRCNTLADYVEAVTRAPILDRKYISDRARRLYDMTVIGLKYDVIFRQITDLNERGWQGVISRKFEYTITC